MLMNKIINTTSCVAGILSEDFKIKTNVHFKAAPERQQQTNSFNLQDMREPTRIT